MDLPGSVEGLCLRGEVRPGRSAAEAWPQDQESEGFLCRVAGLELVEVGGVSPTAESFGVSAQIGFGGVRGGPGRGFYQGSTRVPPEFHQGSTRVPPGFHQGSTRVLRGSARAAGWCTACCWGYHLSLFFVGRTGLEVFFFFFWEEWGLKCCFLTFFLFVWEEWGLKCFFFFLSFCLGRMGVEVFFHLSFFCLGRMGVEVGVEFLVVETTKRRSEIGESLALEPSGLTPKH